MLEHGFIRKAVESGSSWVVLSDIAEPSDKPIPLLPFTLLFSPITLQMGIFFFAEITEKNVLSYSLRKKLDEED